MENVLISMAEDPKAYYMDGMSKRTAITRRAAIGGAIATLCMGLPGASLAAQAPRQLPLADGLHRFIYWTAFCKRNRWAGGEASAELHSINDWMVIADRIGNDVNRAPFRLGRVSPLDIPGHGEPTNCVGSAIRKMALLVRDHGFPSGDARLMYLMRLNPGDDDHAALLLRFREGDFVLDNGAPESMRGVHHWIRLSRRPVLISEGRKSYRAVNTHGVWTPQRAES